VIFVYRTAFLNCRLHKTTIINNYMLVWSPPESVQLLIDAGADLEARDNFDLTPLLEFSRYGAPENIEVLIRAGADLEAVSEELLNETPLMMAIHRYALGGGCPIKNIAALIKGGANISLQDAIWRHLTSQSN
jgi:ankyrin repeat protein